MKAFCLDCERKQRSIAIWRWQKYNMFDRAKIYLFAKHRTCVVCGGHCVGVLRDRITESCEKDGRNVSLAFNIYWSRFHTGPGAGGTVHRFRGKHISMNPKGGVKKCEACRAAGKATMKQKESDSLWSLKLTKSFRE